MYFEEKFITVPITDKADQYFAWDHAASSF